MGRTRYNLDISGPDITELSENMRNELIAMYESQGLRRLMHVTGPGFLCGLHDNSCDTIKTGRFVVDYPSKTHSTGEPLTHQLDTPIGRQEVRIMLYGTDSLGRKSSSAGAGRQNASRESRKSMRHMQTILRPFRIGPEECWIEPNAFWNYITEVAAVSGRLEKYLQEIKNMPWYKRYLHEIFIAGSRRKRAEILGPVKGFYNEVMSALNRNFTVDNFLSVVDYNLDRFRQMPVTGEEL